MNLSLQAAERRAQDAEKAKCDAEEQISALVIEAETKEEQRQALEDRLKEVKLHAKKVERGAVEAAKEAVGSAAADEVRIEFEKKLHGADLEVARLTQVFNETELKYSNVLALQVRSALTLPRACIVKSRPCTFYVI